MDDDDHCGVCGNICPTDSTCIEQECVCNESGYVICDGVCVNICTLLDFIFVFVCDDIVCFWFAQ